MDTVAEACAALTEGQSETDGACSYFLNTFSLGVYPELVRLRERWSPRLGGPLASVLGVVHALRTSRPCSPRSTADASRCGFYPPETAPTAAWVSPH
ncbi:hypothetical protein ACF06X_32855 [Streptomyces sp. NPDC015346]|uniref:hypothetical protein n=1 Tax=Streptomyces sp. NPDC015346 TaxID=3364954 RepID=UPI0036FF7874